MPTTLLPRRLAVMLLLALGCAFAGNHIAARIAFDDGTGVLLAVLCRSGATALVLGVIIVWQGHAIRLGRYAWGWQILLGLLIAGQSLCLYSAVARIPVALALLVANLFPILLALLTWGLGGPRPSLRQGLLMLLILVGLVCALDVPGQLAGSGPVSTTWKNGVLLALCGALLFASALWVSDHKLQDMRGSVRSLLSMSVVFSSAALIGATDLMPSALGLPQHLHGWLALGVLALLYGTGFSILFVTMPRLDMQRNAPVMNIEPVATLVLGWLILGQTLNALQMLGGAIVLSGILLLSYRHR
ncbi:EamA family transporter [Stutzerimonas kirkiae]|uniref:EamA family transporter n=1 Tax=Stutzerimonas kirkiae TaxID=2211392 RepID=A0A4Q9RDQ2_9GAMM|nr:DMT family transporter [Stutzerimonas kirkiae]TBU99844.1 EamA family transporter [Stutzerimonas kirkiae]TBV05224.1 EamA family transporter [Stutzerimonas kirkiae]TBV08126.1 EamA family transporter [Stutzerimonas kirkiae]TBV17583.1 EamA family transporter [Stutzerimonas kirkiae]